jgi:alginate O-acetyltransferase complex protein AlgI
MSLVAAPVIAMAGILFLAFLCVPPQLRARFLAVVCCASYAWLSPLGASLALALVGVAYVLALRASATHDDSSKTRLFGLGVGVVLVALVSFKIMDGLRAGEPGAKVLAPLGLSYFAFKVIAYLIDVWWERISPERDFSALLTYVVFVPQVFAGPIQRPGDFLEQLKGPLDTTPQLATEGLQLILFGIFKKMVVADRLAILVDPAYGAGNVPNALTCLVAFWVFPVQLYADFSALTDVSLGVARLFGIKAPPNFDNPFYAPNVQEFWLRWHMTLTGWLRDYFFAPLQLSLRSWGRPGLALAITANMLAVGLWHGCRPTFAVFGLINGILLVWFALMPTKHSPRVAPRSLSRRVLGAALTFHLLALSFVFFRAAALREAWSVLAGMASLVARHPEVGAWLRKLGWQQLVLALGGVIVMEAIHVGRACPAVRRWFLAGPVAVRWTGYYALAVAVAWFGIWRHVAFIYQQF